MSKGKKLVALLAIVLFAGSAFAGGHGSSSGSGNQPNGMDRRSNYNYWAPNDGFGGPSGSALTRGYYGVPSTHDLSSGPAGGYYGFPDTGADPSRDWPSDPIRYPDQAVPDAQGSKSGP